VTRKLLRMRTCTVRQIFVPMLMLYYVRGTMMVQYNSKDDRDLDVGLHPIQ
jgi:hypothetical protein